MKSDVSNIYINVFIGTMMFINLTLVLYIMANGLLLNLNVGKLFSFSDSFYGALLGAIITGTTAILIFLFDIVTRRTSELKKEKRDNKNNLLRLQLINSEFISTINFFSKDFSKQYSEEHEVKLAAYIRDIEWLKLELKNTNSLLLSDKLLKDYLTYSRLLSKFLNEIVTFQALPMVQKENNIKNLLEHIEKAKQDFLNFEVYVEVELDEITNI